MEMNLSSKAIVEKVLAMDEKQLALFISGLSPDLVNYLDILLEKAQKNPDTFVK